MPRTRTVGQFERRMIGLRTKEALAVKRDEGVRLGRPPAIDPAVARRIRRRRRAGWTLTRIADALNTEGTPTAARRRALAPIDRPSGPLASELLGRGEDRLLRLLSRGGSWPEKGTAMEVPRADRRSPRRPDVPEPHLRDRRDGRQWVGRRRRDCGGDAAAERRRGVRTARRRRRRRHDLRGGPGSLSGGRVQPT